MTPTKNRRSEDFKGICALWGCGTDSYVCVRFFQHRHRSKTITKLMQIEMDTKIIHMMSSFRG